MPVKCSARQLGDSKGRCVPIRQVRSRTEALTAYMLGVLGDFAPAVTDNRVKYLFTES